MTSAARFVLSADFSELERYSEAIKDGDAENFQLGPGRLNLRVAMAGFGPVAIHANAVDNSYLSRALIHHDRFAMFFDIGAVPGSTLLNGFTMGRTGAVVFGPGSELQARVEAGFSWGMVTLDRDHVARMLDGVTLPAEGECLFGSAVLARAPGLAVLARELSALARAEPERLSGDPVAGAVVEAITTQLATGLGREVHRPGRAQRRQMRLVGTAMEFLDSMIGRAVYSEAVSEALGVGPRAVNEAFQSVYGLSLQRYLLIRRLTLARRSLRRGGGPMLVKQIALDCGFWHFGRFSRDYRALFHEMPSDTLAARSRSAA